MQKGDRKMKHQKRDSARRVSANRSNLARALLAPMPKVPANLAPPESSTENVTDLASQNTTPHASTNLATQDTAAQPLVAAPTSSTAQELQLPSTSAPMEALQKILPKTTERERKSPKYSGFDNDDSSGETTNSLPTNLTQPRRKRRVGDIESVQPSVL